MTLSSAAPPNVSALRALLGRRDPVLLGAVAAGLAIYGFQIVAARALDEDGYAVLSVLWTLQYLAFAVVLHPAETFLARSTAVHGGAPVVQHANRVVAAWAASIATGVVAVGALNPTLLGGDRALAVAAGVTVMTYGVFVIVRGGLVGQGDETRYAWVTGGESVLRLAAAGVAVPFGVSTRSLSWMLPAGACVVLLLNRLVPRSGDPSDRSPASTALAAEGTGVVAVATPISRFLGHAVLASGAAQGLLAGAPLLLALQGAAPAAVATAFVVFALARAPLVLGFGGMLSRASASFERSARRANFGGLRVAVMRTAGVGMLMALSAGAAGAVAGPTVCRLAFGSGLVPSPVVAGLVAAGATLAATGMVLEQAAFALQTERAVMRSWMIALAVALLLVLALDGNPLRDVSLAFLGAELTAVVLLLLAALAVAPDSSAAEVPSAGALRGRKEDAVPTPAAVTLEGESSSGPSPSVGPPQPTRVLSLPSLRGMFALSRAELLPAAALLVAVIAVYWLVLPARYGFLDDYVLLYQMATDPARVSDHIVGGGRPVFALSYRMIFAGVEDIEGLRWVRAITLLGLCLLALLLFRLLRSGLVGPWSAAGIALLVVDLPCYQVAASWATMFIMPFAALAGLMASIAASRVVLASRVREPRAWLLPLGMLTIAMTAYQPAAMSFWIGFAVLVFGRADVLGQTRLTLRLAAAHAGLMLGGLIAGFVAFRVGVATQAVGGARAGTVSDLAGKADWFLEEPLLRAFDPWALVPRPGIAVATAVLLALGIAATTDGWGRRISAVLIAGLLLPAAYLPNLLIAENWASTRTLVALMPMVAVLVALGVLALLARLPIRSRSSGGMTAVLVCAVAAAFALHARTSVQQWFVAPQETELAMAEAAVEGALNAGGPIQVLPSLWFDSIAPSEHYDEFGIPSTCQPGPAQGLTQLLVRERTGAFTQVQVLLRAQTPPGPRPLNTIDFQAVLRGPAVPAR